MKCAQCGCELVVGHSCSYRPTRYGDSLAIENFELRNELEHLKEVLEDMAAQFAYRTVIKKKRYLATGGLSALEDCFDALGWKDPHSADKILSGCDYPGCNEFATCGTPTSNGYKHCCGDHFSFFNDGKIESDAK